MTVLHRYQPQNRHTTPLRAADSATLGRVGQMNIVLTLVACAALIIYVVQANIAGAASWRTEDASARLDAVRSEHDVLVAQYSALEDRDELVKHAIAAGMQPAGTLGYLVDQQPVAVR